MHITHVRKANKPYNQTNNAIEVTGNYEKLRRGLRRIGRALEVPSLRTETRGHYEHSSQQSIHLQFAMQSCEDNLCNQGFICNMCPT